VTTASFVEALLAGRRVEVPPEADDAFCRRFEQLEEAGYDEVPALALAVDASVDVEAARRLLWAGCPQALALDILL
jgi:hypothetical protein